MTLLPFVILPRRLAQVRLLAIVILVGLPSVAAEPLQPQDFVHGRTLTLTDGAALGAYTLPTEVITAVHGDTSRIAVFNAQGEVVPFAVRLHSAD